MAQRAAAYQSGGGDSQTATLDSLSKKLSDDLRQHIKSLGSYSLLSKEWVGTADSLRHIADIAVMEQRLPKQEGQEEMTLWDKEDMAVRMVLEEGKLNMCLRVLQEYKALVRPAGAFGAAAGAAAGTLGIPEGEVGSKMCIFEESIGLLLHCAMKSVEAVQTVDLPLLCTHCGEILGNSVACGPPSRPAGLGNGIDSSQEALVVQYLASVGAVGDDIDEDRMASLVEEHSILANMVACLRRDRELFNTEFSVACAKFLAFMCDTEHFQTHHKAYFADEEAMAAFVALQEEVIAPLLSDRAVERKEIRPLMDAVLKLKRSLG